MHFVAKQVRDIMARYHSGISSFHVVNVTLAKKVMQCGKYYGGTYKVSFTQVWKELHKFITISKIYIRSTDILRCRCLLWWTHKCTLHHTTMIDYTAYMHSHVTNIEHRPESAIRKSNISLRFMAHVVVVRHNISAIYMKSVLCRLRIHTGACF